MQLQGPGQSSAVQTANLLWQHKMVATGFLCTFDVIQSDVLALHQWLCLFTISDQKRIFHLELNLSCRKFVTKEIGQQLRPNLEELVKELDASIGSEYSPDAASAAKRMLKNKALQLLSACGDSHVSKELLARFRDAGNMTDTMAALNALSDTEGKLSIRRSCALSARCPSAILFMRLYSQHVALRRLDDLPCSVQCMQLLIFPFLVHSCYHLRF